MEESSKRDLNLGIRQFGGVALQRNRELQQRTIDTQDIIEVVMPAGRESDSDSEWEERRPRRSKATKTGLASSILSESEESSE